MNFTKIIALQIAILSLGTSTLYSKAERVQNTTNVSTKPDITVSNQTVKPEEPKGKSFEVSKGFSHVAEPALNSVVNISTTQIIEDKGRNGEMFPGFPQGSPFEDLFKDFFDQFDRPRKVQALGSGFIIRVEKDKAYIVTNHHVIADAKKIAIFLHDKTEIEATLHASDERTDIAVLKIDLSLLPEEKRNLKAFEWGNSDTSSVGDWVIAIGNPFGLGSSVTAGIISCKGRDLLIPSKNELVSDYLNDFIQHSAQINMGNSGGCLLDMEGKVVGINTVIVSPSGGNVGIGFAIPSVIAKKTVDQLINFGRTKRGWLGLRIQYLNEEMKEGLGLPKVEGVIVGSVTPEGPAGTAGIQSGDIIIEYDGKAINSQNHLHRLVAETEVGKEVTIKLLRQKKEVVVKVKIGEYEEAMKKEKNDNVTKKGEMASESKSIDGLTISTITPSFAKKYSIPESSKGVFVKSIQKGSSAEETLAVGDVIMEVNQKEIKTPDDFINAVEEAKKAKHKNVLLLVSRKGDPRYTALKLEIEENKDSKLEKGSGS